MKEGSKVVLCTRELNYNEVDGYKLSSEEENKFNAIINTYSSEPNSKECYRILALSIDENMLW